MPATACIGKWVLWHRAIRLTTSAVSLLFVPTTLTAEPRPERQPADIRCPVTGRPPPRDRAHPTETPRPCKRRGLEAGGGHTDHSGSGESEGPPCRRECSQLSRLVDGSPRCSACPASGTVAAPARHTRSPRHPVPRTSGSASSTPPQENCSVSDEPEPTSAGSGYADVLRHHVAVAVGFEPTEGVNPHTLSRRAPSAARTRHRRRGYRTGCDAQNPAVGVRKQQATPPPTSGKRPR